MVKNLGRWWKAMTQGAFAAATLTINADLTVDYLGDNVQADTLLFFKVAAVSPSQYTFQLGGGSDTITVVNNSGGVILAAGSGTNTVTVSNTVGNSIVDVDINGQTGVDVISARSSDVPLRIETAVGLDLVNIGSLAPTVSGGNLLGFSAPVSVTDSGGACGLTLDDSGDPTARTITLGTAGTTATFTVSGITTFSYDHGVDQPTFKAGSGGNTITINNTLAMSPMAIFAPINEILCGSGSDVVNVNATSSKLNVQLQAGNDIFTFSTDGASLSSGFLDGGTETNELKYTGYTSPVTVDLSAGTATGTGMIFLIQKVTGGSGNDTVFSASDTQTINGEAGQDTVHVNSSAPMLSVDLGANDDFFVFGDGASIGGSLSGGANTDTLSYSAYTTPVSVNLTTGTATGIGGGITSVENVTGGSEADTIVDDAQANVIRGGPGNDTITSQGGPSPGDFLYGDAGDDLFKTELLSSSQFITVDGGAGAADKLTFAFPSSTTGPGDGVLTPTNSDLNPIPYFSIERLPDTRDVPAMSALGLALLVLLLTGLAYRAQQRQSHEERLP